MLFMLRVDAADALEEDADAIADADADAVAVAVADVEGSCTPLSRHQALWLLPVETEVEPLASHSLFATRPTVPLPMPVAVEVLALVVVTAVAVAVAVAVTVAVVESPRPRNALNRCINSGFSSNRLCTFLSTSWQKPNISAFSM